MIFVICVNYCFSENYSRYLFVDMLYLICMYKNEFNEVFKLYNSFKWFLNLFIVNFFFLFIRYFYY